ncbi:MAG: diacylglycerol/lipid kinase family protein, partial [Candidatus Methylomirabilales bacterium]
MSSPFGTAYVIVNSRAAKRVSGGRRGNLRELLRSTGLDFELHFTEGPGHAVTLARRAIDEGYRYLVSVGGDGTIHEVVNGMMAEEGPPNPDAVLGVISAGTGADFVRTFGLPRDPADAVEHLKGGELFIIDLGRVTYTLNGETRSEYFPNIAEAGLGGDVVRRAEGLPRT